MKRVFMLAALLVTALPAWALDLDDAKAQGLVGEANTGYLAAVKPSPGGEVEALIQSVNAKRRELFQQTVQKTDATLAQVQLRFYQLAVQNTKPGHYYQDESGRWQKK